MNNFAASGLGVLANMAPVCAQVTYWSLGVLVAHHDSLPPPVVNESTRDELVELCKADISNAEVAVPLTHFTSLAARSSSQEWPYLAMMSANRYATASSSFGYVKMSFDFQNGSRKASKVVGTSDSLSLELSYDK